VGLLRITLVKQKKRPHDSPDELLNYLLSSLGFGRKLHIYREILLKMLREGAMSSGELARGVAKRTTVIYHVGRLMDAGILIKRGNQYELRGRNLQELLEHIERDVMELLQELRDVARRIDESLGR